MKKKTLLLDDKKARKVASEMGVIVSGTIGFLIKAEKRGFIESAYQEAMKLKKCGFYISSAIVNQLKECLCLCVGTNNIKYVLTEKDN